MLAFAAVNLLWRLIFWPISQGSYTDGVLQINMFAYELGFWPPLYALITRLLSWIPALGLEGAGRLVSLVFGVLVIFPLGSVARRLFGFRAALWAMVAWTVSPMALRWSLQAMTDMPMTFFWMASLASLVIGVEFYLPGLFPNNEDRIADPRQGNQWLLIASLCGAMATLTRYQGILLLVPLAWAAWKLIPLGRGATKNYHPLVTLAPWLAVPAWVLGRGLGQIQDHLAQFSERAAPEFLPSLIQIYWNYFESFVLISPYFLTYGLFGFFLYGLFRTQWTTARLRWAAWVSLFLALCILVLQSRFAAFQARYLLPLVPLVCLFAGHGMATWERRQKGRPWRKWGVILPAVGYGLIFSLLVAVWQGGAFLDIKQATQYVIDEMNLPVEQVIFTNEVYNAKIGPAKVKFWSGGEHRVELLGSYQPMPGDVIILSSAYGGGVMASRRVREQLMTKLPARVVRKPFARFARPLLPDIMQEPGTHPNPLAWHFRYQRQYFETTVLEVLSPKRPAINMPGPSEESLKALKDIQHELEGL